MAWKYMAMLVGVVAGFTKSMARGRHIRSALDISTQRLRIYAYILYMCVYMYMACSVVHTIASHFVQILVRTTTRTNRFHELRRILHLPQLTDTHIHAHTHPHTHTLFLPLAAARNTTHSTNSG